MKFLHVIFFLLLNTSLCFSQKFNNDEVNQLQYIIIDNYSGKHIWEGKKYLIKALSKAGYEVVNLSKPHKTHDFLPDELQKKPSKGGYLTLEISSNGYVYLSKISIKNSDNQIIHISYSNGQLLSQAIKSSITAKNYVEELKLKEKNLRSQEQETARNQKKNRDIETQEIQYRSENEIKSYLDRVNDPLIGIYDYASSQKNSSEYRIFINKSDEGYTGYIINSNQYSFPKGSRKFSLEKSAINNLFTMYWRLPNERSDSKMAATYENGVFTFNDNFLYKMYPRQNDSNLSSNNNEWIGNGSGLIFSKDGHIITNFHVVENANEIEVEIEIDGEIKKYRAFTLQKDKTNDLAILKIDHSNFTEIKSIPYNFKTVSSDVGTEVYALGYPKALSLMGKSIKFTDGRISSKTGFQDDVSCYQTTTPIQPGNSGGPLFDHQGNLVGINSAKIISSDIEGITKRHLRN